jgi:RNA polymerase sigma-70 factor, ECF subfamily
MSETPGEVTRLLAKINSGQKEALETLVTVVYKELRRMAARFFDDERAGHTLQPTALVHEAWFRLSAQREIVWQSRSQFFAIAAQLMRRILLDHARRHAAGKRGRAAGFLALDENMAIEPERLSDIMVLDEALSRLAALDADQARLVELRFFGGLSVEETAEVMGISTATVKREWASARAWLRKALAKSQVNGTEPEEG